MNFNKIILGLLFLSLTLVSCLPTKSHEGDTTVIDVSGSYTEKEIYLDDIAEVEYVRIQTDNNYLYKGSPMVVTDRCIIIYDRAMGDILFFSRTGSPTRKFNRRGVAEGEYTSVSSIIYDQKSDELFVCTMSSILVYSASGEYKRTLKFIEGSFIREIVDLNDTCLLVCDGNKQYPAPFTCISKTDGSVVDTLAIPPGTDQPVFIVENTEKGMSVFMGPHHNIVKYKEGLLLNNHTVDTLYYYNRSGLLIPILKKRPAANTLTPFIYYNGFVEGGDYQFFQTVTVKVVGNKLPSEALMYDKTNRQIYKQKVLLRDYSGKTVLITPATIQKTDDPKLGFVELDLTELKQAHENNKLSGKLKMLVEEMNEDENNVIMKLKIK